MTKDFIRSALNAVTSIEDLTVGTKLYHVYGIWPPILSLNEYTVIRAPVAYKDHPEYSDIHAVLADSFVFDTTHDGFGYTEKHFCSDGNIGWHHNNNYWFKSMEDAQIYRDQCYEDWKSNPDAIDEVVADRLAAAYDDVDYNDYDYDDYET